MIQKNTLALIAGPASRPPAGRPRPSTGGRRTPRRHSPSMIAPTMRSPPRAAKTRHRRRRRPPRTRPGSRKPWRWRRRRHAPFLIDQEGAGLVEVDTVKRGSPSARWGTLSRRTSAAGAATWAPTMNLSGRSRRRAVAQSSPPTPRRTSGRAPRGLPAGCCREKDEVERGADPGDRHDDMGPAQQQVDQSRTYASMRVSGRHGPRKNRVCANPTTAGLCEGNVATGSSGERRAPRRHQCVGVYTSAHPLDAGFPGSALRVPR